MKKITKCFLMLSVLFLIFTCENEPIDSDFLTENQTENMNCLAATQAYIIATTNFAEANDNNGANYTPLCNEYAVALQSLIDECGDPNGGIQTLLTTIGDCSAPIEPDTCEGATINVTVAENNYTNASDDLYTQYCNVYILSLEEQIEICGDPNGEIQTIIDGLGNCQEMTVLLKKISYSQAPNNNINFFYNSSNQLIKIEGTDGSSKRWTYNNGIVDKAQFYDAAGNLSGDSEEKYIYENGVITERRDSYNISTTPVLDERYEYEFNNDGHLIEIRYFGTNETEFSIKYTYTYNTDGNLTDYLEDYTNPAISDVSFTISNYDNKNYFMKNINPRIILMDDFSNDSRNNPIDNGSTYTYNSDDFPILKTDANGNITTYEYY